MASTSLNMITDLAIAILPLPLIHKLQLPSRQKYALMAVFALAGSVVIVSILRVPSVYDLMRSKDSPYSNPMAGMYEPAHGTLLQKRLCGGPARLARALLVYSFTELCGLTQI